MRTNPRLLLGFFSFILVMACCQFVFAQATLKLVSRVDDPMALGTEPLGTASACSLSADGNMLGFISSAFNLVQGDYNRAKDGFLLDRSSNTLTRIADVNGIEIDADITALVLSSDGSAAAFQTSAALVVSDTNNFDDIYRFHVPSNSIALVSHTPTGSAGDGPSTAPTISSDGQFIAFVSSASNLLSSSINGSFSQIYRFNNVNNNVNLVSRVDPSFVGPGANGNSTEPRISGTGQYIAFTSFANDLITGDTNAKSDAFVRDFTLGSNERASLGLGGAQLSSFSQLEDITADGRTVLFSNDNNIVAADTNNLIDLYRIRLDTGSVTWLTHKSDGTPRLTGNMGAGRLNADASKLVFVTDSGEYESSDDNEEDDVYLRQSSNSINLMSSGDAFVFRGGFANQPCISADGVYLGFSTNTATLDTSDINTVADIYLCELAACVPSRMSIAPTFISTSASAFGVETNGSNVLVPISITRDGNQAMFASSSFNLDPDDNDDHQWTRDLFVREGLLGSSLTQTNLITGAPITMIGKSASMSGDGRRIAFSMAGQIFPVEYEQMFILDRLGIDPIEAIFDAALGVGFDGDSRDPKLSNDGEWLVFVTRGALPNVTDNNQVDDVLRYRRSTDTLDPVSIAANGNRTGNSLSTNPSISDDGRWITFTSNASNLVAGATDSSVFSDIYLRDMLTGITTRISRPASGDTNGQSSNALISGDGSCVVFESKATNLDVTTSSVIGSKIFLYEIPAGVLQVVSSRPDGMPVATGDGFSTPTVNSDCSQVAYRASVKNALPPGAVVVQDVNLILRLNRVTNIIDVLSVDNIGNWLPFNGENFTDDIAISDSGQVIVFQSNDPMLLPGIDINSNPDAYALVFENGGASADVLFANGFE